jgi:hypothetical protein
MRGDDESVHMNAVIAVARLAKHPQNLAVIRELGAMELMAYLGARNKKK